MPATTTAILIALAIWAGLIAGLIAFIVGATAPATATKGPAEPAEPSTFLNHGDTNERHYL